MQDLDIMILLVKCFIYVKILNFKIPCLQILQHNQMLHLECYELFYLFIKRRLISRNSIFIFISNIGGKEIANNLLDLYDQGVKRNEVDFHNFEPIIRRTAYSTGFFYLFYKFFI